MQYRIDGTPLPVVLCTLAAGETMITESGGMAWMSPNMRMETTGGGVGRMFGRMFSGESLFLNRYTAEGGEGIIKKGVENTIGSVGRLARVGMRQTDEEILDIMVGE